MTKTQIWDKAREMELGLDFLKKLDRLLCRLPSDKKQCVIHDVVVNEAVCEHKNEDWVYDESGVDMYCLKCEEKSEVELVCDCNEPDICQDNTGLIYCFQCKKPMTQTN